MDCFHRNIHLMLPFSDKRIKLMPHVIMIIKENTPPIYQQTESLKSQRKKAQSVFFAQTVQF